MKSWGDHCSSDDESVEEEEVVVPVPVITKPLPKLQGRTQQQKQKQIEPKPIKEHVLPTEPPFKAFVGNLASVLTQNEEFAKEITRLCWDRFQATVNILHCHLVQDRQTGRMRGYGYIEVETLDMLQTLLKLNDGKSQISGKTILVDLVQSNPKGSNRSGADNHRSMKRGSKNDMDGSTFRSGSFNNVNKTNGVPPRGDIPRPNTVMTTTNEPSTQRQKLQLKPKTQRNDDAVTSNAYSDIFGAGKKQDVGEWEQRRQKEKYQQLERTELKGPSDTHLNDSIPNINDKTNGKPIDKDDRRQPRREGRGGGGRGGSSGSGASGRNSTNSSARGGREGRTSGRGGVKDAKKLDAQKPVTRACIPATKPVDEVKTSKVINKFSALAFGEDSDSD